MFTMPAPGAPYHPPFDRIVRGTVMQERQILYPMIPPEWQNDLGSTPGVIMGSYHGAIDTIGTPSTHILHTTMSVRLDRTHKRSVLMMRYEGRTFPALDQTYAASYVRRLVRSLVVGY